MRKTIAATAVGLIVVLICSSTFAAEECLGETKLELSWWRFELYLSSCDRQKFQDGMELGQGGTALLGIVPGGQIPSGVFTALLTINGVRLRRADEGEGVVISGAHIPGIWFADIESQRTYRSVDYSFHPSGILNALMLLRYWQHYP